MLDIFIPLAAYGTIAVLALWVAAIVAWAVIQAALIIKGA